MFSRNPSAPILLIVLAATAIGIGTFARGYDVERMVVWHDEVFTLLRTFGYDPELVRAQVFTGRDIRAKDLLSYQHPSKAHGFADTLASLMTHPEHSPLFFLAAWVATPAFQTPLAGVRGTSVALSLLLIPAGFWLARELFKDSATAWLFAALCASSPMYLLYAQEARQYALFTVVTAAASAAFLRAVERRRTRDWTLYGVLIALGLYTHLLFVLVLIAHGAYLLLSIGRNLTNAKEILRHWSMAVVAALLIFAPWIALLLTRADRVAEVTAWMQRPVPLTHQLEAWGLNLVRVFADFPMLDNFLLLGLIPLAWVLWQFNTRAPRSIRRFTYALFFPFVAAVLVPDVIQGGSRSLHARYALPGFLALQLAVAYVLAQDWRADSAARQIGSRFGLFLVLGLGLWSSGLILEADTWWSKNFSASNRAVAEVINSTERPLVIIADSGVGLGEAVSLAYGLGDHAIVRGEPRTGEGVSINGFRDTFMLTPSAELRAALSPAYDLVPVLDTWQWYRAVPKTKGAGT